MRLVAVALCPLIGLLLGACATPRVEPCGAGFCPVGLVCIDGLAECAVPSEACPDLPDGTRCAAFDRSICLHGACTVSACNDGYVDALLDESCDLGGANSQAPDAECRTDCEPQRCGDGVTDVGAGESCDGAAASSDVVPDACRTGCRAAFCGDGIADASDQASCLALPVDLGVLADPNPRGAFSVDLDGDRLTDLVITRTDASAALLFGRPDAGFDRVDVAAVGQQSQWAAADVGGDGDLDLIGRDDHQLFVLDQLEPRSFAPPVAVDLGLPANFLTAFTAVDLDHDGRADLVGFAGPELRVRRALAGGGFAPVEITPITVATERVAAGLIDDDADVDLYVLGGNGLSWLRGDGTGGFLAEASVTTVISPADLSLLTGDFDGDARLDAAMGAGLTPVTTRIWLSNGDGSFAMSSFVSSGITQLTSGDLEPDGDLDLIGVTGVADPVLQILRNGGLGSFVAEPPTSLAVHNQALYPGPVVDFDHDGFADLFLVADAGVLVARGGDDTLGPAQPILDAAIDGFVLPDLDGDGDADVVADVTGAPLAVLIDQGGLRFARFDVAPPAQQEIDCSAAADLDGDGRDELVLCDLAAVRVYGLTAPQTLAELTSAAYVPPTRGRADSVLVGDIGGDGRDDLLVVSRDLTSMYLGLLIYAGAPGPALLAAPLLVDGLIEPSAVQLLDWDGDGRADLLAREAMTWTLHRGRASGDFAPAGEAVLGAGLEALFVDLDQDGDTDAVVSTATGLGLYLGDASGALEFSAALLTTPELVPLLTADLNGDAHLDLVVADVDAQTTLLWLGDGAGGLFGPVAVEHLDLLRTAELTGDGRADVVARRRTQFDDRLVVRAGRATLAP